MGIPTRTNKEKIGTDTAIATIAPILKKKN
jgi:hypothetical protein